MENVTEKLVEKLPPMKNKMISKIMSRIPRFFDVIKPGLSGALLITFTACAPQSSDSLGKYSQLKKKLGPVHNTPSRPQEYQAADLYSIDFNNGAFFVVGQRNVITIRTALNLKGTKYRLISRDLPDGSEPLKDLGQGMWEFAWTPSSDTIPQNLNETQERRFHLALDIYDVSDLQAKSIVDQLSTETEVNYKIVRTIVAPEIVAIKGIAPHPQVTKLAEGDVVEMTIIVNDLSASPAQIPELIPVRSQTASGLNIRDGKKFFEWENDPKQIKKGVWEFKAKFDTVNNSVSEINDNGKVDPSPTVLANLSFKVLGANHIVSPVKTVTFEITYRRELLRPGFQANPELQMVKQNSTWSYKFKSFIPSAVGTLTTFLSEETVKLPGTPKLACTKNRLGNEETCNLTWKVPCSLSPGDVTVKINAAAQYLDQNTAMEFLKKVTISENKKCSPPQSLLAAPSAPSSPSIATPTKKQQDSPPNSKTKPSLKPGSPDKKKAAIKIKAAPKTKRGGK
jgi:hypothetical protein